VATVVAVGARALLDSKATSDEFLGVRIGLFAVLDDGRRIDVDSSHWSMHGPRRGLGAVWVRYDGDGTELPALDRALYARDPNEAITQALQASYRLQPKDIEDDVRLRLFEGGFPIASPEFRDDDFDEAENRKHNERQREILWENLVRALRRKRIQTTWAALCAAPFEMEFDAALVAELER
jgi:hypothetical protein